MLAMYHRMTAIQRREGEGIDVTTNHDKGFPASQFDGRIACSTLNVLLGEVRHDTHLRAN